MEDCTTVLVVKVLLKCRRRLVKYYSVFAFSTKENINANNRRGDEFLGLPRQE